MSVYRLLTHWRKKEPKGVLSEIGLRAEAERAKCADELEDALLHLEGMRRALENAQAWSDRWRAHAFNMKSDRNRWRDMLREVETYVCIACENGDNDARKLLVKIDKMLKEPR